MGDPEVLQGLNGVLKAKNGSDLDVEKTSQASHSSDLPATKKELAEESAAVVEDHHRRSGRPRTVRVRDGFFDSSLL